MPFYGGMSAAPRRYGGKGDGPRVERILESLNAARGTAYDTSSTSVVYAENLGIARAIDAAWSTNVRLAHAFDPQRLHGAALVRWERIMGLTPSPTATEADRRAAVVAKWQRFGQQFTSSRLVSEATRLLGSTLVSVQVATAAGATSYWPGGTPSTVTPWMSTIRRILFLVTQPAGMTDVEFYDAVNAANAFMDGEAPADVTWSWYRADAVHGVQGFYLDSTHNLDNSAFDV